MQLRVYNDAGKISFHYIIHTLSYRIHTKKLRHSFDAPIVSIMAYKRKPVIITIDSNLSCPSNTRSENFVTSNNDIRFWLEEAFDIRKIHILGSW